MSSSEEKSLTLCGSFGFGNAGDEAVPYAFKNLLESLGLDYTVRLLSRFSEPELKGIIGSGGSDARHRKGIAKDPLLFIGGGVIEKASHSVLLSLEEILQNEMIGPRMLFASSAEPHMNCSWLKNQRHCSLLKDFRHYYVRDIFSKESLTRIIGDEAAIEIIGDSVIWLEPDLTQVKELVPGEGEFIGVTLMQKWSEDSNWTAWIVPQLIELSKEMALPIVFIPMSTKYDDDRVEHRRIASLIREREPNISIIELQGDYTPAGVLGVYSRAKVVVSMRLHGCVMAYSQRVPFIGLDYCNKIVGFCKTVGWDTFFLPGYEKKEKLLGLFGADFVDASFEGKSLLTKVQGALVHNEWSFIEIFKNKQKECLLKFLKSCDETL